MREQLVSLIEGKLGIPIYYEMVPEDNEQYPCCCYLMDNDIATYTFDDDLTSRESVFSVDFIYNNLDELDRFKCKLLELSGNSLHAYRDLFQLLLVRSVADAGPMLGITTDPNKKLSISSINLSLFE